MQGTQAQISKPICRSASGKSVPDPQATSGGSVKPIATASNAGRGFLTALKSRWLSMVQAIRNSASGITSRGFTAKVQPIAPGQNQTMPKPSNTASRNQRFPTTCRMECTIGGAYAVAPFAVRHQAT